MEDSMDISTHRRMATLEAVYSTRTRLFAVELSKTY
ncbi:hypothetical protein T12_511 [Trichinella patagoniensis]|uniref:Uncharacterized protein n=1 Tax=Trichinella patagoniensis TaxID=990121 RepID=A0A0V0YVV2_9BILA|nr:hypothetical protein T12_12420 [Trichinella patagoniensis]KRY05990.1 hypothetical protein T12_511 [Trichinella patagoniensis]